MIFNKFLLLMLPFLITYGSIISYFDLKYKKIPNSFNKLAFLLSILLNLLFYIFFFANKYSLHTWIITQVTSIFLNFLLLFLLWFFDLISAADVKCIVVFFFLLPPIFYFNLIPYTYHSIILQTAIIILFLSILPRLITNKSFKNTKYFLEYFKPKIIINFLIYIYGLSIFSMLLQIIFPKMIITPILNIFIMLILFYFLRYLFKQEINKAIIILSVFRIFVDFQKIINLKIYYFIDTLLIPFLIIYILIFLMYLSYDAFTKEIKIEELEEGMILAERIEMKKIENKIEFNKTQDFKRTIFEQFINKMNPSLFEKEIGYSSKIGLTQENISKIKNLKMQNFLKYDTLRVFDEIPFGIFIFIGMILIYIFNGDPVTAITYYFLINA